MVSKQTKEPSRYETALLSDSDKKVKRQVFLHEYVYVLVTNKLLSKDALVFHIDNDTLNNDPENLMAGPMHKSDYHKDKDRVFHEDQLETMLPFLKEHFPDVVEKLKLE